MIDIWVISQIAIGVFTGLMTFAIVLLVPGAWRRLCEVWERIVSHCRYGR